MRLTVLGSSSSEGIPKPYCTCHLCRTAEGKDKRFRSSYLIETSSGHILLDASPDFRQQQLKFNLDFDYLFVSHRHFDHIQGLEELRQDFVVGKPMARKKLRYIIVDKHFCRWLGSGGERKVWGESTQEAYLDLLKTPFFRELTLYPYREKVLNKKGKLSAVLIEGIHGHISCCGMVVKEKGEVLVYLADISEVNDKLARFLSRLDPKLTIAHVPFFNRLSGENHWGVKEVKSLPGGRILLSHFSHRVRRSHEELVEQAKIVDPRFIVAYDGMKVSV